MGLTSWLPAERRVPWWRRFVAAVHIRLADGAWGACEAAVRQGDEAASFHWRDKAQRHARRAAELRR
jgi:hypothetical protein